MNYKLLNPAQLRSPVNTLCFFSFSDDLIPYKTAAEKKSLRKILNEEGFKGKENELIKVHAGQGIATRIILGGLGKSGSFTKEKLRRVVSKVIDYLKSTKIKEAVFYVPDLIDNDQVVESLIEVIELASYSFDKYKSKPKKTEVTTITIVSSTKNKSVIDRALIFSSAAKLVRDLVSEPPSNLIPENLAQIAKDMAKKERLQIKIYNEKQIKKMGMNSFLGVSLGSNKPPRFVHITYSPAKSKKTVCFVGKGITFDSGGLSLKPNDAMQDMKMDMAGAATTIGVIQAAARLKLQVTVHAIFPTTENMPGQGAYKIGDVLRASNGKTIEVNNTDAEGRLVLADALVYASKLKPDYLIDIATLTGACVIALGLDIAGLFSNSDELAKKLIKAGKQMGEQFWRMPLEDYYFQEYMKSDVADIKNSGGRYGGSITAALFLKQFVSKGLKWCHLDIAGPGMGSRKKFYIPKGGTGIPARALIKFLENLES